MLNNFIAVGRLVKDPVLSKTNNANFIGEFDLAIETGKDETTFISCKCFKNVAENVCKYANKGSKVAIVGSLHQRKWLAKDGSKRLTYEVLVNVINFLDDKPDAPKEVEEPNCEKTPQYDPYTGKPLNEEEK